MFVITEYYIYVITRLFFIFLYFLLYFFQVVPLLPSMDQLVISTRPVPTLYLTLKMAWDHLQSFMFEMSCRSSVLTLFLLRAIYCFFLGKYVLRNFVFWRKKTPQRIRTSLNISRIITSSGRKTVHFLFEN